MNVRFQAWFVCLSIALGRSAAFGTDLRDVLAHPEKYETREVDLIGIARVPGYFYLFVNIQAAAKTDLSKAVLIRQDNFAGMEYREADRQWVRVTGVMSSKPRRGWDPGNGVLLKRIQLLRDRPAPRIKDWTVLGVFQNATAEPLTIQVSSRSEGGVIFFLGPHEVNKTIIWEKIGKPIASGTISFRTLPPDYQYSPEWSEKRTMYFRIANHRIESIPNSAGRNWMIVGNASGVR